MGRGSSTRRGGFQNFVPSLGRSFPPFEASVRDISPSTWFMGFEGVLGLALFPRVGSLGSR